MLLNKTTQVKNGLLHWLKKKDKNLKKCKILSLHYFTEVFRGWKRQTKQEVLRVDRKNYRYYAVMRKDERRVKLLS